MGQLDEAIRAHLELKRKHGVSEEELHAEEQEALGPVRRDSRESPPAAQDEPGEEPAEHAEPLAQSPDLHGEPLEEVPPEAFHEPVEVLPAEELHEAVEDVEPAALTDPEFAEPEENFGVGEETVEFEVEGMVEPPEPFEAPDPVISPESPADDTPPRGFDVVEDAPPEEEDVLEETPDFLQETPEHDRLWFEQKPPRDFDFDE